jgi:hypothetical protein
MHVDPSQETDRQLMVHLRRRCRRTRPHPRCRAGYRQLTAHLRRRCRRTRPHPCSRATRTMLPGAPHSSVRAAAAMLHRSGWSARAAADDPEFKAWRSGSSASQPHRSWQGAANSGVGRRACQRCRHAYRPDTMAQSARARAQHTPQQGRKSQRAMHRSRKRLCHRRRVRRGSCSTRLRSRSSHRRQQRVQRCRAPGQGLLCRSCGLSTDLCISTGRWAANEYLVALLLAPWWADAYLNYGLLQETMNHPAEAVEAYSLYLHAAPDAPDRADIQVRIYEQEAFAKQAAARLPGKTHHRNGGQRKEQHLRPRAPSPDLRPGTLSPPSGQSSLVCARTRMSSRGGGLLTSGTAALGAKPEAASADAPLAERPRGVAQIERRFKAHGARGCCSCGEATVSDAWSRAHRWQSCAVFLATDGSTVTALRRRPAARPGQARPPRPAASRSPESTGASAPRPARRVRSVRADSA